MRILVSAALLAAVCAAQTAPPENWDQLIARGEGLERSGQYSDAIAVYRQALALVDHPDLSDSRLANTLNVLGIAYNDSGAAADARHCYHRALTVLERTGGKQTAVYAVLLDNLASNLLDEDASAPVESMMREAEHILERVMPDDERLAVSQSSLAELLTERGKYRDADPYATRALAILEKQPNPTVNLAIGLTNLGLIRRCQKRFDEAIALQERAAKVFASVISPRHPAMIRFLNNAALTYSDAGREADARKAFQQALAIASESLGPKNLDYGKLLATYAIFLRKTGHKSEAQPFEVLARDILRSTARTRAGMTVDARALR